MRHILLFLALVAFALGGCGDDKSGAPADGGAKKTIEDAGDAVKKGAGDAAAEVTYRCSCGKEKTAPAGDPPS